MSSTISVHAKGKHYVYSYEQLGLPEGAQYADVQEALAERLGIAHPGELKIEASLVVRDKAAQAEMAEK